MGTRTVTGIIYHLDGTPWAAGEIKFTLMEAFETSTETYPRETHTETLDANGAFSITLGVPDSGTAHYQVETPDKKAYDFFLAAGAATTLETILLISGSPVSQDAVQTLIDAHVDSYLHPEFNVKSYGALGNGVADDTVAIQAAIDACVIAGGGKVYFPAISTAPPNDYYKITSTLIVDGSVMLVGEARSSKIGAGAEIGNMILFQVIGGRGYGGGAYQIHLDGKGLANYGFYIDSWHWIRFINCEANDLLEKMFYVTTNQSGYTEFVGIEHCDSININNNSKGLATFIAGSKNTVTDSWISNSNISGLTDWGIEFIDVQRCRVNNFGASSAVNFSGGISITNPHNVAGAPNETGWHIIDGIYVECNAEGADPIGVYIDSPGSAISLNRFNSIRDISMQPITLQYINILNTGTTQYRTEYNHIHGIRGVLTVSGQINIGTNVLSTSIDLLSAQQSLPYITDSGYHTLINHQNSYSYGWNGGVIYTNDLDVGDAVVDTDNGKLYMIDKLGDAHLIAAKKENWGAISIADGGTIAHGLGQVPIAVIATPTIANEFASVTEITTENNTKFTVAIKKHDGTTGTTQTIYWRAWA